MKRSHVYLAGSSLVVVFGLIAIAWGQRGSTPSTAAEVEVAPAPFVNRSSSPPRPIPMVADAAHERTPNRFKDKLPAANDPFQAARRSRALGSDPDVEADATAEVQPKASPFRPGSDKPNRLRAQASANADDLAASDTVPDADDLNQAGATDRAAGDPFGLRNKTAGASTKFAVQTVTGEGAEREPAPLSSSSSSSRGDRPWSNYPSSDRSAVDAQTKGQASLRGAVADPNSDAVKSDPFNSRRPTALGASAQDARAIPQTAYPSATAFPQAADVGMSATRETRASGGSEGTGRPGTKQLEGLQSAQITVEKTAPREIQVGKPATFEIKVKNTGSAAAQGLEIHDEVPKGTQLIGTTPRASRGPRGELIWVLGGLKAGEEVIAKVELMPVAEGEIGSVATVHFDAGASVRTVATKPELALQVSAPRQVMIGDDVTLTIKVSNPGTGAASGIFLEEKIPAGLQHSSGPELEFDIGLLKPGESRQLDLTLKAVQAGQIANILSARGDGSLKAEERSEIEVIAPALKVALTGPSRRALDRPVSYTVSVSNPGTAAAKDIELITHLPKGLKFVKANNSGFYDSQKHRVVWSLAELPPAESGNVTLTAVPIEEGEQKLRIEGKAQQGLSDVQEQTISVEGVAALMFEIVDLEDPVEVGGEASYEIRVVNQGSKSATNVRVAALMPVELKAVGGEGPTRHALDNQRVIFDPLPRLAAKADATFRIRTQVLRAGDLRVRAQITSDDMQAPVTKEESTRVYQDE